MFGLELCDDDSYIVDCDSIVLCCAAVDILQSGPRMQVDIHMYINESESTSLCNLTITIIQILTQLS